MSTVALENFSSKTNTFDGNFNVYIFLKSNFFSQFYFQSFLKQKENHRLVFSSGSIIAKTTTYHYLNIYFSFCLEINKFVSCCFRFPGLMYVIETQKVMDLKVNLMASYVIVPQTGFYNGTQNIILLDLGHFKVWD